MQVLFELCRFRNHHPAFNGTFELLDTIADIKGSTVLLPTTACPPTAPIRLPGAVAPTAASDTMTEGPPGASGSFAAQTASLLASRDGEEQDFLANIVLERSSIDLLASVDPGDLDASAEIAWYVFARIPSQSLVRVSLIRVCFWTFLRFFSICLHAVMQWAPPPPQASQHTSTSHAHIHSIA
jgi:hypothetical protein